jgi:hypothetical protein
MNLHHLNDYPERDASVPTPTADELNRAYRRSTRDERVVWVESHRPPHLSRERAVKAIIVTVAFFAAVAVVVLSAVLSAVLR